MGMGRRTLAEDFTVIHGVPLHPIASALAGLLLLSCSYEAPRRIAQKQEFLTDSLGRTVIAQRFMDIRIPRGLAAFPDGGRPRIVFEAADIAVCDAEKQSLGLLATLTKLPDAPELSIVPVVWASDTIILETRGYASPVTRQYVHIDMAGNARLMTSAVTARTEYQPPRTFCRMVLDSMWTTRTLQRQGAAIHDLRQ